MINDTERKAFEEWLEWYPPSFTRRNTRSDLFAAFQAGAALSTEAQPEVTGAVVWIRKSSLAWCGVGNGLSQVSFVKREGSDGYVIPLSPPSAIEAAVREKLEEAARICDEIHWKWRIGDYSGPQECAEAIRALMESPQPGVEEPAN